ncbi:MAG: NAD(P)-dependent oxidoreductase, partial [Erysipelothrix sp.]
KHFLKDLKLILDEKGPLYLPVVENVTKMYQVLSDNGYSEDGTQAIIEYYLQELK